MQGDPVVKNFKQDWKILVMSKVDYVSDVPNIIKTPPIVKWMECLVDFLHQIVGERKIPFSYVIF